MTLRRISTEDLAIAGSLLQAAWNTHKFVKSRLNDQFYFSDL